MAYLRGLPAPVGRKNGWQLAGGGGRPHAGRDAGRLLGRMRWDADAVRDDLRAYVVEHLGGPGAVLVLDETGFVKEGEKSVGVQRQDSGAAGRVGGCRVGVFLGYAGRHGRALIDRALSRPRAGRAIRRGERGLAWRRRPPLTKPKLGAAMLERALDAGVPCAWVAGDGVCGADRALRRRIEARGGLGHVLAVTGGRGGAWAAGVPPEGWRRLGAGAWTRGPPRCRPKAGTGRAPARAAKGPRLHDRAFLPYRGAPPGRATGPLVRRELDGPDEPAFHLTPAPAGTDLATLVRVAGTRWTIEACFEAAKGEVGLDEYEVRSWAGWHRHVTLAMLAHAYLAVVREAAVGGRGGARPGRGAAAADRAGGAPAALGPALGAPARPRGRPRLVALAPPPPAARPPLPLATPNRLP